MSAGWHSVAHGALLFVAFGLVGCGGKAEGGHGDQGTGVECEYGGQTYEPGDDFPAMDGCNSCACGDDGQVACTVVDCPPLRCDYGGSSYELGAQFPAGDGCNTCRCTEQGVTCGTIPCNRCLTIENQYGDAHDAAKRCNPAVDVEQCTHAMSIGLACSCPSFVNPANADAIQRLERAATEYGANQCSSGVVCGACLEPVRGFCSADGVCEDVVP